MSSSPDLLFPLVLLTLVAVAIIVTRKKQQTEPFVNLSSLFTKPNLYWFCDSSINARQWNDFGSRNSNKPNKGYLEVALGRAIETQPEFNVIPIIGREELYSHLPNLDRGALELPPKLWREFVIANLLAAKGGLVMDGDSTLCLGPSFYRLLRNDAITFGINPDEALASPITAVAPGPAPYVGWSRAPNHPAWLTAAKFYNDLVARGPTSWSAAIARRANQVVWEKQKTLGCVVMRGPDGGRLPNGKLRQLEDIFGTKEDPWSDILPGVVYLPYDGEDLSRRYEFNWFLRLSPDQLRESNIVWSKLSSCS